MDSCTALNEARDANSTHATLCIAALVAGGVITAGGVEALPLDGSSAKEDAKEDDSEHDVSVVWQGVPRLGGWRRMR